MIVSFIFKRFPTIDQKLLHLGKNPPIKILRMILNKGINLFLNHDDLSIIGKPFKLQNLTRVIARNKTKAKLFLNRLKIFLYLFDILDTSKMDHDFSNT